MTEIFIEQNETMREHGILLICIKTLFALTARIICLMNLIYREL